MDIGRFVTDFAAAMTRVDNRRPQATSPRTGRIYQPGIGPHPEDRAVDLVLAELRVTLPDRWSSVQVRVPYPDSRQKCDIVLGEWAIEVKMARPNGDNGKPDDTSIKDILSPYESDRSAVSDAVKLAATMLAPHKAILIYGFDCPRRPLLTIIEAFEVLASQRVVLGPRCHAPLGPLVHPVHQSGTVLGWEVSALAVHAS
jgi:hypothetical protein